MFPDTPNLSCPSPKETEDGMMFLSQDQQEEIDYVNKTHIVDIGDDDTYEDIEAIEEDEEMFPDGTVVKFKCSQTRSGKFVSWQIRSVMLMGGGESTVRIDRTKDYGGVGI